MVLTKVDFEHRPAVYQRFDGGEFHEVTGDNVQEIRMEFIDIDTYRRHHQILGDNWESIGMVKEED